MSALINPMAHQLSAIGGALRVARVEGVRLYDDTGRSWIDCECGGGVLSLGHRHPDVIDALNRWARIRDLGNHHLVSENRAKLASDICSTIGDTALADLLRTMEKVEDGTATEQDVTAVLESDMRCVFNVSAGEAVDCAVKLARGATDKTTIACADNAFHGHTGFALAASAFTFRAQLPAQAPGFLSVPYGPTGAIAYALERNPGVAAVLLEPVAVEAGCILPPRGYLRDVHAICRAHNALLIVDESVTGLGRTGTTFAWQQHAVVPDIFTIGGALGGGIFPISVTCHSAKLDRFYVENPFIHVSTFGGGEVGCAAARTALRRLTDTALLENVRVRGEEFRTIVQTIVRDEAQVRGVGLLNAIELENAGASLRLQHELFQHGVLCRTARLAPQTLLFLPPLTITSDEIAAIADALHKAFCRVSGSCS